VRVVAYTWPAVSYEQWRATCDTLHAHTQILGKLAVVLAPPEPELQHAALRLTARGFETALLPAPDGSGALVAALDLRSHEAVVEHSDGRVQRVALTPDRAVADVTGDVLQAVSGLAGAIEINPTPQEVPWTVPLDDWWGSLDLAVNLFSGRPADPPADDFITRNSMDAQEVAIGWWPGDTRYGKAAFYGYLNPPMNGFADADLSPARWEPELGLFMLDWDDVRAGPDPHAIAVAFAHALFRHACAVCDWDPALEASAEGQPPPVA